MATSSAELVFVSQQPMRGAELPHQIPSSSSDPRRGCHFRRRLRGVEHVRGGELFLVGGSVSCEASAMAASTLSASGPGFAIWLIISYQAPTIALANSDRIHRADSARPCEPRAGPGFRREFSTNRRHLAYPCLRESERPAVSTSPPHLGWNP